jgi:hypothetical protein
VPKLKLKATYLRQILRDRGIKMNTLAQEAGVGLGTLSKAFSGNDVSEATVQALQVSLDLKLVDMLEPGPVHATYSAGQLREKLLSGSYGRAPCSAFLAGDLSVLTTKRAYVVAVDALVHVGVRESAKTAAELYFPHGQHWVLDHGLSKTVGDGLRVHLGSPLLRKHFPWLPTAHHLTVVSEIPAGFALYEEVATAVALSNALRLHCKRGPDPNGEEALLLAGALLSARYRDISWATLVASQQGGERLDELIAFDRHNDGGIDVLKLYRRDPDGDDFERNVYPAAPFWTWKKVGFNVANLRIYWSETKLRVDLDSRGPFSLEQLPMHYVLDQMDSVFKDGGEDFYRRFGLLMQLHQLTLATAQAVRRDVQQLLTRVNGFPGVLGAKLACGRGSGAIVVLADHSIDWEAFDKHMRSDRLHDLATFKLAFEMDED